MKKYSNYELQEKAKNGEIELSIARNAVISLRTLDSGSGTRFEWDWRNGTGDSANLLKIKDVRSGEEVYLREYKQNFLYDVKKEDIDTTYLNKFIPVSVDKDDPVDVFLNGDKCYDSHLSGYTADYYVSELSDNDVKKIIDSKNDNPNLYGNIYFLHDVALKRYEEVKRREKHKIAIEIDEFAKNIGIGRFNSYISDYLRDSGLSIDELKHRFKDEEPMKNNEVYQVEHLTQYSVKDLFDSVENFRDAISRIRDFENLINDETIEVNNNLLDISIRFNYKGEENEIKISKKMLVEMVGEYAEELNDFDDTSRVHLRLNSSEIKVRGSAAEYISKHISDLDPLSLSLMNERGDVFYSDEFILDKGLTITNEKFLKDKIISKMKDFYKSSQKANIVNNDIKSGLRLK